VIRDNGGAMLSNNMGDNKYENITNTRFYGP